MNFESYWASHFDELRIRELDNRWIVPQVVDSLVQRLPACITAKVIGYSAEKRPIHLLTVGQGAKHVVAWAAMHGNETTCLRGWLDWLLNLDNPMVYAYFKPLFEQFTIHFIPMLNPDGAQRYTRRNAMEIDMNRDARALQTPEMQILMGLINEIKPDLAFNLHDQRNIFAVNGKPATISFLTPSVDEARTVTEVRELTMDLIGFAAQRLAHLIPNQMGRYTDEYYPTAIGEYVMQRGIPTILVECGAAQNDPLRQEARKANAVILYNVLQRFTNVIIGDTSIYLSLPVNEVNQVDILVKGVQVDVAERTIKADIALMADYVIVDGTLQTIYKVSDVGDLQHMVGLETHQWVRTERAPVIQLNALANLLIITDKGVLRIEEGLRM